MIELIVTSTGKGYHPKETFRTFDHNRHVFPDLAAAEAYITETYGKAKRTPMYIDTKDGTPKKIGYVIGFRNADWSHSPVEKWIQQDWIEFRETKTITP